MDESIMKYVPKSKRHAILDAYKDQDGYWICIKSDSGYEASRMESGCHVIHEDTVQELRYQIAGIKKECWPTKAQHSNQTNSPKADYIISAFKNKIKIGGYGNVFRSTNIWW